jgi:acyl dehydratase
VPAVTELSAGHVFPPVTFTITEEQSRYYRESVGDALPIYDEQGLAPPLAVAALALAVLLDQISLPAGSLHASESMQVHAPVPSGSMLEARSVLVQRSVRSGWVVSVLNSEITLVDGAPVLTTRASVMTPQESA